MAGILVDSKDTILRANLDVEALLNIQREDLTGKSLTDIIEADDNSWCSVDPVDNLGTPSIGRELRAKVAGKRREFRTAVYALDEDGTARLVTLRDQDDPAIQEVTDLKTSLEELCACVAHEIRNPLTGIRTTVQFISSKMDKENPHREDLSAVLKEMDRIEEIIGDLLRFGRPADIEKTPSDINGLLERVLATLEQQLTDSDIDLKKNLSTDVPTFPFSPDALQQVFLNLVRNGVEAMPEGGRLSVSTALKRYRTDRPEQVEITVSDTGPGIPEDLLNDIFKPFFTTRHNGTGLGLPISLGIIRSHGGTMTARNRNPGGAAFKILLPLGSEEKS